MIERGKIYRLLEFGSRRPSWVGAYVMSTQSRREDQDIDGNNCVLLHDIENCRVGEHLEIGHLGWEPVEVEDTPEAVRLAAVKLRLNLKETD